MKLHRLGLINRNQGGFTLIELMLAIAISSIIAGSITMTVFQVFISSARTSNHMTVVGEAESAGYWISRDVQMAQVVAPTDEAFDDPDGTKFPLTLTWTDWDSNDVNQVVYTLVDMPSGGLKNLQRSHSTNGDTNTDIIAQFIDPDPAMTSCNFTDTSGDGIDDTLILKVTATVGAGPQEQSETRVYEVKPRPGSW